VQNPPVPAVPPPAIARRGTNSLAVVSLAAAVASYLLPHPFVGALIAVICGHAARSQIRRSAEAGAGLALAGLILGYLHLAVTVLLIALFFGVVVSVLSVIGYAASHGGSLPSPSPG
jgi:Domain of unknown function (DUF4190)